MYWLGRSLPRPGSWSRCVPIWSESTLPRTRPTIGLLIALAVVLTLGGCGRSPATTQLPTIATTTSYLEAAARDVLGRETAMLRLAEPGTCPGHFDIRPSQALALQSCGLLLRFDFQKSLDARLAGTGANAPRVGEIVLRGGMGRPDNYLTACRRTADHLSALGLLSRTAADLRLQTIAARLDAWSREATNRVADAGLAGRPVITSAHQRDFCEWLGLRVVATFRAADTASIGEIEEAIDAGKLAQVRLVIANLPEGRRTADALAARLGARVVVFENFPALHAGGISFDAMLTRNLQSLLQVGAGQPKS